jgi:hypothetical protein
MGHYDNPGSMIIIQFIMMNGFIILSVYQLDSKVCFEGWMNQIYPNIS